MNYRNKKLLAKAKDAPCCFLCGSANMGDVVAAHSNQLKHGKGTGIKAHDNCIAYLCHRCHQELDQGKKWSKEERIERWTDAHIKSFIWLFQEGHLEVV